MKKTFLKEILHRRVPQIIGSYVIASITLVGALDWMVARYGLSGTYITLAIFCLISIMPSVVILAYFHGAPGKDDWTKIEKYGIPINVLFIGIAIFFGKSFETKEGDENLDNFYCSINSSQIFIDQKKEVLKDQNKTLLEIGVEDIQPITDDMLEEILANVHVKLNYKLKHKEVAVYFPKNKNECDKFNFTPDKTYYISTKTASADSSQRFLPIKEFKEKFASFDDSLRNYYNTNIDGYFNIHLSRMKIEGRWGIRYEFGYLDIYKKENNKMTVGYNWVGNSYIGWEDEPEDDIAEEIAILLADEILDKRYGGDIAGRIDEILDEDLVSINFTNKSFKVIKGTHMFSGRTYAWNRNDLEYTYENFDRELDDLQREVEYIKKNPSYILETHCVSCLEWELDNERDHDPKNIKFILEDYLSKTQVRIDELTNNRQELIDNMTGDSGYETSYQRDIYFVVIKVSDGNIIAKIIGKAAPYLIPKIGDNVSLKLD